MFKPLHNRVLVKPDELPETTESGIYLVHDKQEKPISGRVIVGNDTVQEGERVLFSKFGYDEVEIEKQKFCVVSDFNLLGIYE